MIDVLILLVGRSISSIYFDSSYWSSGAFIETCVSTFWYMNFEVQLLSTQKEF